MHIYMIMPRYSHNYALFYQLLAVICSPTVIYAILREATSETYGPRVYFPSYKFPFYFILHSLLSIYIILVEFIPPHHVILPNALLCSYELNTLDACWIAVDVWSNSSRCRQESVYMRWT